MTFNGWLQIALYCAIIVALVKPMGGYMTRLFAGERIFLAPVLGPIERGLYRLAGIDPDEEQHWTQYAIAMLLFNLAGFLLLYLLQRLQGVLSLNPQDFAGVDPDLAFNTAVSFTTNTNWQSYVGETTMSYLTQMVGLTVHNFVSAATGIALAIALIRGFARRSAKGIGNFWADLTRGTLYLLLPISFIAALFMVWQGVPQNLNDYITATTVEGATQVIAQGPNASQEAIKMLGTNGGGFFNANSAHPYSNPTPLTTILQIVLIFVIGAGLYGMLLFVVLAVFISGLMVGRTPEYVGKKIEAKEVKMTMLAVLILPLSLLGFLAIASITPTALASPLNAGPHGFSEIFYAYASGTGNNGSAFAGLTADTWFYNLTLGFAMLLGRFAMIVPMVALAGALAAKGTVPASAGTFPTHGALFIGLLIAVVLIVGALTYLPALALGPIVEHFAMLAGEVF